VTFFSDAQIVGADGDALTSQFRDFIEERLRIDDERPLPITASFEGRSTPEGSSASL